MRFVVICNKPKLLTCNPSPIVVYYIMNVFHTEERSRYSLCAFVPPCDRKTVCNYRKTVCNSRNEFWWRTTAFIPMKRNLLLLCLLAVAAGCGNRSTQLGNVSTPITETLSNKNGESTACAYWKCSVENKMYMQKYVRSEDGKFRPAGTYKLGEGVGAFPLDDLDKFGSDGEAVSVDVGHDPCPYCGNKSLVGCRCGKTYCEVDAATSGTCPWCGVRGYYESGSWDVGGGG